LERGELIRLLPEWDAGTVDLNALYAGGGATKPSARAFVDYLIAALRELRRRLRVARTSLRQLERPFHSLGATRRSCPFRSKTILQKSALNSGGLASG
jgi:hypothetical protein